MSTMGETVAAEPAPAGGRPRNGKAAAGGMSAATAKRIERGIIALCAAALVFIFQPFSKDLSALGMGLVVLGGLAFNLVPLCEPGRPLRDLVRVALIVALIFVVVLCLAIGSAVLYGYYLAATR
ncbi:MAG TPA: hypothetical protein VFG43_10140 [Geminicoccaceae bacterium]|nr:hypothetical protein [Geminicoccaceae bacterium]